MKDLNVAVLVPCLNEQQTIGAVVRGFKEALPEASIYVWDNGSDDDTRLLAVQAGAEVHVVNQKGKGSVVRRMFSAINADIYVLVDGDDTYDPGDAEKMIKLLRDENLEMVVGSRIGEVDRFGHSFGNRLFNRLYRSLFANQFTDIFSGYRVFSRAFVKSFPAVSNGFEVETEMSVHASQLGLPVCEVDVSYRSRPPGSKSKLRTIPDGFNILWAMFLLLKENKPFLLFGFFSLLSTVFSLLLGIPVVVDFVETGLVEKLPTAVFAASLAIFSLLGFSVGLILEAVERSRLESKRLVYLQSP